MNRAGASGILGSDLVANAAPDGDTVPIGITTLVQMPYLIPKLPYEVFKGFTPVAQLVLSSNLSTAGRDRETWSRGRTHSRIADVQARINDIGLQTVETGPDLFAAALRNDFAVWGRLVREAQIKID